MLNHCCNQIYKSTLGASYVSYNGTSLHKVRPYQLWLLDFIVYGQDITLLRSLS